MLTSEPNKYEGAVIVADALGTKYKSKLRNPAILINEMTNLFEEVDFWTEKIKLAAHLNGKSIDSQIFTISDTIICTIKGSKSDALEHAGIWSIALIMCGIIHGFPFRGALGYGDIYLEKENKYQLILGSAINEVSKCHCKGEIIGIYTVPSLNTWNLSSYSHPSFGNFFERHEIQTKDVDIYECWIANWVGLLKNPSELLPNEMKNTSSTDIKAYLERKFTDNKGVNSLEADARKKIKNTLKFFDKINSM